MSGADGNSAGCLDCAQTQPIKTNSEQRSFIPKNTPTSPLKNCTCPTARQNCLRNSTICQTQFQNNTHSLWTHSRQDPNYRACQKTRCECLEKLSARGGLLWDGRRRSWPNKRGCIGPTLEELSAGNGTSVSRIW